MLKIQVIQNNNQIAAMNTVDSQAAMKYKFAYNFLGGLLKRMEGKSFIVPPKKFKESTDDDGH
jgi:hypothetical protein